MLPRVHIVGGGMAGLSAAYQLSREGWRSEFSEITVYQTGWRLGGKAASGRRAGDLRIEEHGLHVWFGSYVNSFRMMRDCFAELQARDGAGAAGDIARERWSPGLTSVESAFTPSNSISATEFTGAGVDLWTAEFPEVPGRPWDDHPPEPSLAEQMGLAFLHVAEYVRSAVAEDGVTGRDGDVWQNLAETLDTVGRQFAASGPEADPAPPRLAWLAAGIGTTARLLNADADVSRVTSGVASLLIRLVDRVSDVAALRLDDIVLRTDGLRRAWQFVDILLAVARGLLRDGRLLDEDLDHLDDMDFSDWLTANGASTDSTQCAIIRAVVYDLAFAYEGGRLDSPSCGAGTALRGMLRLFFTYRGSILWKMTAGMGDVVVAPLYELLVKRGVTVRFHHFVEQLCLDGDGRRVQSIEAVLQDDAAGRVDDLEAARARLSVEVDIPGRGLLRCWPSVPDGLDAAAARDLEIQTEAGPDARRVSYEVGSDDHVVVAVPVSCLRSVAKELVAARWQWQAMVENLRTVATQSAQLWCTREPRSRTDGRPGDPKDAYLVGGYVEPFDTWADMSHLLPAENHPADSGIRALAYLCNALDDTVGNPEEQAVDNVRRFLRDDAFPLWTNACRQDEAAVREGGAPPWHEFDWSVLAPAGGPDVSADEKEQRALLRTHYIRVNTAPAERYVQSVPGTTRFRLRPDRSGFENVYLAGDWTYCGLNSGCIEAAVTSGMIAARAISGTKHIDIAGWPYPRGMRRGAR